MTSTSARVLVTGADGFVGGWLLERLRPRLSAGSRLVAVSRAERSDSQPSPSGVEWIRFDLTSPDDVDEAVCKVAPTHVVHLAAVAAPQEARQDPSRAWAVNLNGTLNLSQSVLRHVPDAHLLFVGTSEVYGGSFNRLSGPADETTLLDPATTYAATKAAADLLIGQMARDGLRSVRFRPFNHTGPGQTERYVVPAFAAQIARIEQGVQEPVLRVGNLDARRDFLDVRDVVDAYVLTILRSERLDPGTVINLASGRARRVGDILDALLARARTPIRVEQDPARMRAADTPLAVGDASRASALLGWKPSIAWDATLDDVLGDQRGQVSGRARPTRET